MVPGDRVTLRPYRAEDEAAVVALWWRSWHSIHEGLRHPRSLPEWRARWADEIVPWRRIVVAEDQGVVIGFAAADLSTGVLDQIFVEPDRQHHGVGRRLLAWAQESMPSGFSLRTLEDNVDSRAFYERHGLTPGGTAVNPFNGMSTIEYRWRPEEGSP